jgi:glutamate-ammonia-ligase adenylyltransferase
VTTSLQQRLADAVSGTVFDGPLTASAAPFFERRCGDEAAARIDGDMLRGLARVLASQPKAAGFLSHRPRLFERIADAGEGTLAQRAHELTCEHVSSDTDDLETRLDELRILRREETCLAACLDLGGVVPFDAVSEFLSVLAETVTQRALALALQEVAPDRPDLAFSVIGMGKIAGREFTYHSDLDLIFLYEGEVGDIDQASRVGQRTISYLATMTGAGVAYAVDTRLRPSGQQGMLVTTFDGFERYQLQRAQTWEHLALVRARAIAGDIEAAQRLLDRVRGAVIADGLPAWPYVTDMRSRVQSERGGESSDAVPIKTGHGGLMDIDFLAGGSILECGASFLPHFPSVPAMLRSTEPGEATETLLRDYMTLRIVEARCRWLRGHAIETLETGKDLIHAVAELVEPGLSGDALLDRIAALRVRVRSDFDRVSAAESIDAIGNATGDAQHAPGPGR